MSNEIAKRFIVDDWGMSPAINEAALYLAERGLLYGISVIPHSRFYDYKLREILATNVQIGCHTNLTFETGSGTVARKANWLRVFLRILSSVLTCFSLSGRKRISAVVAEQAEWVKNHMGHLDYLDGHHHIHLYPGVLGVCREVCALHKIRFRLIYDKSFKSNFLLAMRAKLLASKEEYFECLYLGEQDLENEDQLLKKIDNSAGLPVAIHPATYNDFDENDVNDHFIEGRVEQFLLLKKVLKI